MFELRHRLAALASQVRQLSSPGAKLVARGRGLRSRLIRGVRGIKTNLMNGLRVYVNTESRDTRCAPPVFYSRREDGPHYQWFYDDTNCRWRAGRILTSSISPKMLSPATWKELPAGLKTSIVEHYQD
jgi:hypothetical protein